MGGGGGHRVIRNHKQVQSFIHSCVPHSLSLAFTHVAQGASFHCGGSGTSATYKVHACYWEARAF